MCGRFTQFYTWEQVHEAMSLIPGTPVSNLEPRYNIRPTNSIDVVVQTEDGRLLQRVDRWDLVPRWWKKPLSEKKFSSFNAMAETITEKPTFRASFKDRRCIIPASGFYEWQLQEDGRTKVPHYIHGADTPVQALAGLYDVAQPEGEEMTSATIVVCPANDLLAEIHNTKPRMPVILDEEGIAAWLGDDTEEAAAVMKPCPDSWLDAYPVGQAVNRKGDAGAECIEPA